MITRILICVILLIAAHTIFAQERPEENAIIQPSEKNMNHYVGLQVNQLIRNILSFGGTSTPVTNPYLLVYSANSKTSGVGFTTGLGLSSIQTKTTDNFLTTTSKVSDFSFRFGLDVKKYLSHQWLLNYGWDLLAEGNKSTTTSESVGGSSNNPSITTTTSRTGTGPRVGLNFQFHERLIVGTEASYYFKWIDQKTKVKNTGAPDNNTDSKLQQFQFTLPAVIFLIVKF
jgi:hypothetical protein